MKRFFLVTIISLFFVRVFSQTIPNAGFENWQSISSYMRPVSWQSTDTVMALASGAPNVNKETTDFYSGASAVRIETGTALGGALKIPGAIVSGKIQLSGFSISPAGGFSCTTRVKTLSGWYKYFPGDGDSATVKAFLFKRNSLSGKRDTIAEAELKQGDSIKVYSQFSLDFVFRPWPVGDETPDSALIFISSSHSLLDAIVGSTLLIDDLSFSGTVASVNKTQRNNSSLTIYPNPASNEIKIKFNSNEIARVNVFDILGKKIKSLEVNSSSILISTSDMNDGLYFYQLANKEEEVIATGKFSVKK